MTTLNISLLFIHQHTKASMCIVYTKQFGWTLFNACPCTWGVCSHPSIFVFYVMNKTWRRIMWILGFHTWTSTSLNRSVPKLVSPKGMTTRKVKKRLRRCQARMVIVRILPNVKTTEVLSELGPNWLVWNILFLLYYGTIIYYHDMLYFKTVKRQNIKYYCH